ncbi:helix-turn-helix transcriptional regulator [Adhaeribacter pallidiroseus]|uniref:HTH-type transcriptional activator RhaS n=1 Tax=Adhaeribacter pallidiroseus TaxID=2072847 RepID=A0A369QS44_9BACT|nr:helix-turn-helix transcriptional regulator [Adhaeribacter pallidiroseus]RDC66047.1 HTH-type transcriptional activator RhaS [Adhaeribacter pallidiroseus]
MIYYTLSPAPELAAYVRFFWVLESKASVNQPYVHRSMADGCAELIFHYQGCFKEIYKNGKLENSFTAGLHGPSQNFRRFIIDKDFGIFGVYLYPFAVDALFAIPATIINNQMPDLVSLLGAEGAELGDKMNSATNTSSRVAVISAFLQKKLIKNQAELSPAVFTAIKAIIHNQGVVNIDCLADQTGFSRRQFERKFKNFSGFSPKLFSRIIRFQAALKEYGNRHKSLTEIAYTCGYYDQSHFIHDFKEFSGYCPGVYFSGKSGDNNYKDS